MSLLSLQGSFKVDVYNEDKGLIQSEESDNFITSSGLSYIYDTSVADCFKYLSIGSGTSGNSVYTDGLESGDSRFQNLGTYVVDANGYSEVSTGVRFFRAWLVSGLTGGGFTNGLDINELMVSPENAGNSGKAFSRVLTSVSVPSGDYSVITYRLDVGMPTGKKSFAGIINDTLVNTTESTGDVCRYWDLLSGKYSLVHHGLDTISAAGVTQSTPFGNPMEPSQTDDALLTAYLSTDSLQFVANGWSGGAIETGAFKPWNPNGKEFGTGVLDYHDSLDTTTKDRIKNARRGTVEHPDSDDFTSESNATVYQEDSTITTITPDAYTETGRSRSITRLFSWPSVQNQFIDAAGVPRRIKSMVCAYTDSDYYPYADFLFASSGLELDLPVNTGASTIDADAFTGDYVFIDPYDNLSLSVRLSWSSPCPTNVSGCPGYV